MFVDEKAMGEPQRSDMPDHLPWRYPLSIILSLVAALFCYNRWLDNVLDRHMEVAGLWSDYGNLAIALAAAVGLVAWIHGRTLRVTTGPPF